MLWIPIVKAFLKKKKEKKLHVFYHLHIISDWFSNFLPLKFLHFLQLVMSKTIGIGNFKGRFLKIMTPPEKLLTVLVTSGHISKSRSMKLILVSNESWKCAPYNDTKSKIYLKCHLFPVLWEYITHIYKDILAILLCISVFIVWCMKFHRAISNKKFSPTKLYGMHLANALYAICRLLHKSTNWGQSQVHSQIISEHSYIWQPLRNVSMLLL